MIHDPHIRLQARREPLGLALVEVMTRAEANPVSGDADVVAQLRVVVAAAETPIDRLLARYRG